MKVEERRYFHRLRANKNKKVLKENLMVISLNNRTVESRVTEMKEKARLKSEEPRVCFIS